MTEEKTYRQFLETGVRGVHDASRGLEKGECQSSSGKRCTLCLASRFSYEDELPLRTTALRQFWKANLVTIPASPLVPSPKGREYRTVTKRRVFLSRNRWVLGLIDTSREGQHQAFPVLRCAIEPREHAAIYAVASDALNKAYAQPLAECLRYVIIKGNYKEFTVIFNVSELSPRVAKSINTLSKNLTRESSQVVGVHIYVDRSDGRYYLGTDDSGEKKTRRLFGESSLFQQIGGKPFFYSPESFSQVNQSIVGRVVDAAGELLSLRKKETLYDLYCGYGLFSLCLAPFARRVVGVEISHSSVDAAIANARRHGVSNARFLRLDILAESVSMIMKSVSPHDVFLLDPPRNGSAAGVIDEIAARKTAKVLHIFCNIDVVGREVQRWGSAGYRAIRAIPFDMFPGTSDLEMLVLLERATS